MPDILTEIVHGFPQPFHGNNKRLATLHNEKLQNLYFSLNVATEIRRTACDMHGRHKN
jgi:hypothetical protein